MTTDVRDAVPCAGHAVAFYDDDSSLAAEVGAFVAEGLASGETAFVVATEAHVAAIAAAVVAAGIDVEAARAAHALVELDAGALLSTFMVDGQPDAQRFAHEIGRRIAAAGRPVRIFGEMVALLWDAGQVPAAIELEGFWNDLALSHAFALLCAYPVSSMDDADRLRDAKQVCDQHTSVLTPSSYEGSSTAGSTAGDDTRTRFFVPVPLAARAVRRFVADALAGWHAEALTGDAMVIVSELVSNAVRHAVSPFRFTVERRLDGIRFAVQDADPGLPARRDAPADAPDGRGVTLVAALSRSWGTENVRDGKVVWAEIGPVAGPR